VRILCLAPRLPYPPTDGGRIALIEPIKRLAGRGHDITLLCFGAGSDRDSAAAMRQFCQVELVHHDTRNRLIPAMLNIMSSKPYTISKYHSEKMRRAMRHLLVSMPYDLAHAEHLHMASYLSIAREFGVPAILRQQNVESLLAQRFAHQARGFHRLYAHLQVCKVRRYEAAACEAADLCFTITEIDALRLRQLNPRIRTAVVPAGVDTEYFRPQFPVREEPYTIVWIGSMDWLPNVDAVRWFCDNVFPQVKQRLPQAQFYVVGKNPATSIRRLGDRPGIVVTGFVEDVREHIAKCSVFVVPLRIGSGMRLKILQAMAMGKAIVSTSIGAEGISAADGRDILLADTVDAFARSTLELLANADLRYAIGGNARKLVESSYSWDRTVALMERIYERVVRNGKGEQ
jgi:sugar transferase (PEP-CTERM/EpsH1 system associated)